MRCKGGLTGGRQSGAQSRSLHRVAHLPHHHQQASSSGTTSRTRVYCGSGIPVTARGCSNVLWDRCGSRCLAFASHRTCASHRMKVIGHSEEFVPTVCGLFQVDLSDPEAVARVTPSVPVGSRAFRLRSRIRGCIGSHPGPWQPAMSAGSLQGEVFRDRVPVQLLEKRPDVVVEKRK